MVCQEPVPGIFEDASCALHIQLPAQRNYTQKKYESESEDEITPASISPAIKREEINFDENVQVHQEHQQLQPLSPPAIAPNEQTNEMFESLDEAGTNVTICHDQFESVHDSPTNSNMPAPSTNTDEPENINQQTDVDQITDAKPMEL